MATVAKAQAFRNYIGGKWVDSASGETFENRSPATGELLGVYPRSNADDVARAVAAAKAAQRSWALTPAPKRGEILYRAAELLRDRKEDLARVMTREMGKVLAEARGDVQEGVDMTYFMAGEGRRMLGQEGVDMTYFMAGEGRRMLGDTTPSELPDKFCMTVREPVGVVGLITPWNFPLAIPTWKMMPALVAGNTIVFKPAEDTPECALRLVEILEEAGLPGGVVNVVFGFGPDAGEPLAVHPDVDVVSFTGSTQVGHYLAGKTGALGKRISLEMGGKNAISVLDDADLELAAEGILWSAFGTSGQRCTAGSRVIVHEQVYDELVERVVAQAKKMRLGDGLDPDTDVGPVINREQLERIHGYTKIGRDEGAKLACGGDIAGDGELAKGHFYRPTVFTDVTPGMRIAQEEIFGPTTSFLKVRSLEEAVEVNNGVQYGLSSSVYTRDVNRAFRALRDLKTGIVYLNAGTIGAEVHLPFGGVRHTGNGHREAGQTALDVFTEWKSVYVDFSGKLQKAQIDNS